MYAHNHILIILVFDEEWTATHALIRENFVLDLSSRVAGFRIVLGLIEKESRGIVFHTIGWIATEEGTYCVVKLRRGKAQIVFSLYFLR